jgi:hypothetical protein
MEDQSRQVTDEEIKMSIKEIVDKFNQKIQMITGRNYEVMKPTDNQVNQWLTELKNSTYYKNISREQILVSNNSVDYFHVGLIMGIEKAHLTHFPQDEIKSEDDLDRRLNTLLEFSQHNGLQNSSSNEYKETFKKILKETIDKVTSQNMELRILPY